MQSLLLCRPVQSPASASGYHEAEMPSPVTPRSICCYLPERRCTSFRGSHRLRVRKEGLFERPRFRVLQGNLSGGTSLSTNQNLNNSANTQMDVCQTKGTVGLGDTAPSLVIHIPLDA